MSEDELKAAWLHYSVNRDLETRNKLVVHYMDYMHNLARRIRKVITSPVSTEDIASFAVPSVIRAVESFDVNREATFMTFCYRYTRAKMMDAANMTNINAKNVLRAIRKVRVVAKRLEKMTGRKPTVEEISLAVGATVSTVEDRMEGIGSALRSIKESKPTVATYTQDPGADMQREDLKRLIGNAVGVISGEIVWLRHAEGMQLAAAAKCAGITASYASKLYCRAMPKLRELMADRIDEFLPV